MVGVSLKSCIGENSNSQEHRGDTTTNIGDNGQDALISEVHFIPGDVLDTHTHTHIHTHTQICYCVPAVVTVTAPTFLPSTN